MCFVISKIKKNKRQAHQYSTVLFLLKMVEALERRHDENMLPRRSNEGEEMEQPEFIEEIMADTIYGWVESVRQWFSRAKSAGSK